MTHPHTGAPASDTMGDEDAFGQKSKHSEANVDMMRRMALDTKDQEDREILAKVPPPLAPHPVGAVLFSTLAAPAQVDEQIGLAEKRRAAIDDIKRRDREAASSP